MCNSTQLCRQQYRLPATHHCCSMHRCPPGKGTSASSGSACGQRGTEVRFEHQLLCSLQQAQSAAPKCQKRASVCNCLKQSLQACICCPWLHTKPPYRQLLATSAHHPASGPSCCHPRVGKCAPHSPAGVACWGAGLPPPVPRDAGWTSRAGPC